MRDERQRVGGAAHASTAKAGVAAAEREPQRDQSADRRRGRGHRGGPSHWIPTLLTSKNRGPGGEAGVVMDYAGGQREYRAWAATVPNLRLFHQPWWLDAVCGRSAWSGVVVEERGRSAAMPFALRRRRGLLLSTMPPLTPYLGPVVQDNRHVLSATGESDYLDLVSRLIQRLPPVDLLSLNLGPGSPSWVPFHWHGFMGATRFTYVLPEPGDRDSVLGGCSSSTRGKIRKAERVVHLEEGLGLDVLLHVVGLSFARQELRSPYPEEALLRLLRACESRDQVRLLSAVDSEGRVHAGCLLAWDEDSMYYLMSGADPQLRQSGAMSLILAESITLAGSMGRQFDFEGSMIESIAQFFRGFGGTATPFMHVRRSSRRFRVLDSLRDTALAVRGRPPRPGW